MRGIVVLICKLVQGRMGHTLKVFFARFLLFVCDYDNCCLMRCDSIQLGVDLLQVDT
jgi:hypothetical protein